ncbi:GM16285 [Drosophila sechellia]|uniref:GM16285 n=1 Tax=Drosophila sechellia TaxID=7238 RepID=B4IH18_DROSE|nr:GM16285 [Drosophila sechellia]
MHGSSPEIQSDDAARKAIPEHNRMAWLVITVINSHALQVSISIANSNSGVWSSSAIGVPALDDSDLRSPIYEISEIAVLSALAEELIFISGRTKVYE